MSFLKKRVEGVPHIEGVCASGGQAPPGVSVSVSVMWRRPSFNETKTTLKKVCEMCDTNRSSMLKCSGCNCTYYCSKECQKKKRLEISQIRV